MVERRLTGAQIVWESLIRERVGVIFGIPGGTTLPLYDALSEYPGLRHVLTRHEQGAAFAANGFAIASGEVGVCIATSGPGATNLVTGIATAHTDSVPMVVITGQVATHLIGSDAFQEADTTGITLPITKVRYLVRRTEDLASTIRRAFYLARTGRPGPVLIDIPVDVQKGEAEFDYPTQDPVIRGYIPQGMESKGRLGSMERQVDKAVIEIGKSQSPVIIAGRGIVISGAESELKELAERIHAPVASTLLGLSAFPQDHPLALGMLGMHGTDCANKAVENADIVFVVGMRLDDRATMTPTGLSGFAPKAKVIHIDIDPAEIGKNVKADVPIVGDAKVALQYLNSKVLPQTHSEWLAQIAKWRSEYPANQTEESELLLPQYCIKCIMDIAGEEATIVTGVGQHQMWVAQHFISKKPFISSGGLGAMGFGLPAAIGAQVARPGEVVCVVDGDGSFQMSLQELATVVQEGLPVKIFLINNGFLGMVGQWQREFYGRRYTATRLSGPDFVKLAEAYGIPALRVTRQEMVESAIRQVMQHNGPYLTDFRVNPEEDVHPWVLSNNAGSLPSSQNKEDISRTEKRILVALVQDEPGVTEEATSLFRRRGFNLESVVGGPCGEFGLSRITIVVEMNQGDNQQLEQAREQLKKLDSVMEVFDIIDQDFAGQEMALIKIDVELHPAREKALVELVDDSGGKIVETTPESVIIGVMGNADEIEAFVNLLRDSYFEVRAQVRFGLMALRVPD